jgi:leader peptidase (prepilin peptidase)/N-methyltransferase
VTIFAAVEPATTWLTLFPLPFWYVAVFLLGTCIGSFLNVCIHRLPLEKSLLWPATSRCGSCYKPIAWYDNIPLVSYWALGGRCRMCGARFSFRYFFIELFTALCLVGLFHLEVARNVHAYDAAVLGPERFARALLVTFLFHAALLCFLLVATFSDFDHQVIPLSLTVTGTLVGLVGAALFPWPWPYMPSEMLRLMGGLVENVGRLFALSIPQAVYPWPPWLPLPHWLQPGGTWRTGLATGLAGVLAGTLMLRVVRFLFGFGMGSAYSEPAEPAEVPVGLAGRWLSWVQRVGGKALGLGDADLMMMAGAFLGWQPILVAFFVGVIPGLFLGLAQLVARGNKPIPFGPALAVGVVTTMLGWRWISRIVQPLFFDTTLLMGLGLVGVVTMLIFGFTLRFGKRAVR